MRRMLFPTDLHGQVRAPSSKSEAQRLLICAALSDNPTEIRCPQRSRDIDATVDCLCALGASIYYVNQSFFVTPIRTPCCHARLDCGESGATLRFLLPIVAAMGVDAVFRLHGRLPERPLEPLCDTLRAGGCRISRPTADTLACTGRLHGDRFRIAGNISSQFLSGFLLALPLTGSAAVLESETAPESEGYVNLTLECLRRFHITVSHDGNVWQVAGGQRYRSDGLVGAGGDWSSAACWLCAGALSGKIGVSGLRTDSEQPDRAVVSLLERFGAAVECGGDRVLVAPSRLQAIRFRTESCPDLVPVVAVVAACASGTTRIDGIRRLRLKESDRVEAIVSVLNALGGSASATENELHICGGGLRGGTVDCKNDHRIVMMAALASCVCKEPILLHNADAVQKSYPNFWNDFAALGGKGCVIDD